MARGPFLVESTVGFFSFSVKISQSVKGYTIMEQQFEDTVKNRKPKCQSFTGTLQKGEILQTLYTTVLSYRFSSSNYVLRGEGNWDGQLLNLSGCRKIQELDSIHQFGM